MWKHIGIITGTIIVTGGLLAGTSFATKLNTNTATVSSPIMGADVASGQVVNGQLTSLGKFMQLDLNSRQSGRGYAPKGNVGALTNNPSNCILDSADGGYQHRFIPGAQAHSSGGCTTAYFSSSPQTAPNTGQIINNATDIISSTVPFSGSGSNYNISGGVSFTIDPTTGVVSEMNTVFSQNMPDMGGTPGSGTQVFDFAFNDPATSVPVVLQSLSSNDEIADQLAAGSTRNIPWSFSINQELLGPIGSGISETTSGTTNGMALQAIIPGSVPGYVQ